MKFYNPWVILIWLCNLMAIASREKLSTVSVDNYVDSPQTLKNFRYFSGHSLICLIFRHLHNALFSLK